MGNFYANLTLRGPDQNQILSAVAQLGYKAFVGPTQSGLTIVCEEQSDTQDPAAWHAVAQRLSAKLSCPAFAVLNHDDDIFAYLLFDAGTLVDDYNSTPGYWEDAGPPSPPQGGEANVLCRLFGMPGDQARLQSILRSGVDEDEYLFAFERHQSLVKALGWPELESQLGFNYVQREGGHSIWRKVG